jgi:hypothetical protein
MGEALLEGVAEGIVENHPWFSPFGRIRFAAATKFAPGEFVEPFEHSSKGLSPHRDVK